MTHPHIRKGKLPHSRASSLNGRKAVLSKQLGLCLLGHVLLSALGTALSPCSAGGALTTLDAGTFSIS